MFEKTPDEVCEENGHKSHEIEDRGAPGQVFWCERCHSVREVRWNPKGRTVSVIETGKAEVLANDPPEESDASDENGDQSQGDDPVVGTTDA